MDIKKLLTGTIAGGIVFFLLGWLVYGILLANFMHHHVGYAGTVIEKKDMDYVFLAAGQLLMGALLAWIFIKAGINTLAGGLVAGAVIGLLLSSAVDFTMYGTTNVLSKTGILADVAASTVISAIAGAVIGAVMGGKK
jgi:hypothetical protein